MPDRFSLPQTSLCCEIALLIQVVSAPHGYRQGRSFGPCTKIAFPPPPAAASAA